MEKSTGLDLDAIRLVLEQAIPDPNKQLSRKEFLEKVRMFEKVLLESAFQKEYCDSLITHHLIGHLEQRAIEQGLEKSESFLELKNALHQFSQYCGRLINGDRGERFAKRVLNRLHENHIRMSNVVLEFNGEVNEYDEIIFTEKDIFIIEVKFAKCDTTIDRDGYIRGKSWSKGKLYNVGERMQSKEYVLWKTLEGLCNREQIHTVLFFSNRDCMIVDNFGKYPACNCGTVNLYISDIVAQSSDDDKPGVLGLEKVVRRKGSQGLFKCDFDFGKLVDSYLAFLEELVMEPAGTSLYSKACLVEEAEVKEASFSKSAKKTIPVAEIAFDIGSVLIGSVIGRLVVFGLRRMAKI